MIVAMKKIINLLFIIDTAIVIFTILSGNRIWLINSQIAFITSSLVIFASLISYRNMVNQRVEAEMVTMENSCDTIDSGKEAYKIINEEKQKLKQHNRSVWQITKDSRPSFSFYRLGAYSILIGGFFYLNNTHSLDITSYLISLSLPILIIIILLIKKN